MNNVSSLFENLMTYSEISNKKDLSKKRKIVENDSTILNLAVEIPSDSTDITPDDVQVDVGIMSLANEEEVKETEESESDAETEESESEETPEEDSEQGAEDGENSEETKEDNSETNESLIRNQESAEEEVEKEARDFETAKKNILKRVGKNESLLHLDNTSLNKLFTQFVKDNYKNIDKVVISKAVLENKTLKLAGLLVNSKGIKESFELSCDDFNSKLLEGKRFIMGFVDSSNTFNIIKESKEIPFAFKATLTEGVLKFEAMKYSFKTQLNESKIAEVSGKCIFAE